MYNLRAANWHTYFVGASDWGFSVWAHNAEYSVRKAADGTFEVVDSKGNLVQKGIAKSDEAESLAKGFNDDLAKPKADESCAPKEASRFTFTREMLATSEVMFRGPRIDKIDKLLSTFGGTRKGWVKKKGWDAAGNEWHWYEHHGIGRKGLKRAGEHDPF